MNGFLNSLNVLKSIELHPVDQYGIFTATFIFFLFPCLFLKHPVVLALIFFNDLLFLVLFHFIIQFDPLSLLLGAAQNLPLQRVIHLFLLRLELLYQILRPFRYVLLTQLPVLPECLLDVQLKPTHLFLQPLQQILLLILILFYLHLQKFLSPLIQLLPFLN